MFHAHWHLIPRRKGDCEKPRGGVKGRVLVGRGLNTALLNAPDQKRAVACVKVSTRAPVFFVLILGSNKMYVSFLLWRKQPKRKE